MLVGEKYKNAKELRHLIRLADEKNVPIEYYPLNNYKCCGISKKCQMYKLYDIYVYCKINKFRKRQYKNKSLLLYRKVSSPKSMIFSGATLFF